MKKLLRKVFDRIFSPYFSRDLKLQTGLIPAVNKQLQILLMQKYQELLREKKPLPKFIDTEFRAFSQNGEDGILLYIFSLIGMTNRIAVEVCAGNGIESNSANLIVNHGFRGLLFDGDEKNIKTAREFFEHSKDTFVSPPKVAQAWITKSNINDLIKNNGISGEIDLLSVDMDGVDYWIWKAINVINPRVVVVEYHEELGTEPITVPYSDNFRKAGNYFGASLPAFTKLAREKGYRLIGSNRQKFNGFYIRNDIAQDIFPEVSVESCLRENKPEDYTLVQELKGHEFTQV